MGHQEYLKMAVDDKVIDDKALYELGNFSMSNSFFYYHEKLGSFSGPFLKPIEIPSGHELPYDLLVARRYKGKTNEMFTHFLCNIARYSSSFSGYKWSDMRILDPLAGGGTTLFTALYLGAEAAGVEKRSKDVQSTVSFLKQYTREQGILCEVKEERIKKSIKKYWFTIGEERKRCLLVKGETTDSPQLIAGFKKPHCIVTDLPYGIQHGGKITDLLTDALPEWASLLLPGGTIVMSWESSRFPRKKMKELMKKTGSIRVFEGNIYENMSHRVDRVIKERDVIVAGVEQ
jgi:tRNA G10  N-methylase Trm11